MQRAGVERTARRHEPDLATIAELAARVFPGGSSRSVERVAEGVSTFVYRIRHRDEVFYLRVLPADEGSFAPEVLVHQLLRARNVRAPEVVYYEDRNAELGCSVMIVAEIPGRPLGHAADTTAMRSVLVEAGKDLAVINGIGVDGFGWILRGGSDNGRLRAEYSTYREFIQRHVDEHIALLADRRILSSRQSTALQEIFHRFDHYFDVEQAVLAHGDWDATHIYQRDGSYTGMIDFGEIRGANLLYDLGHFSIENSAMLPYVLEGYRQVAELPSDYPRRIHFSSLLVALRRLGRRVARHLEGWERDPDYLAIGRDIRLLLA